MATTRLEDVIVPTNFGRYMRINTAEKAEFITSGLVTSDESISSFLSGGGLTTNLPFWRDLAIGNGANIASDDPTQLAGLDKVQAGKMVAVRNYRTKGWSSMHLTSELAGSNAMERIVERVSNWWTRVFQRTIVRTLDGVMKSNVANNGGDMVRDIAVAANAAQGTAVTDANLVSPAAILDTEQTLGDAKTELEGGVIIMHSAVETRLTKLNLITFRPYSEQDPHVGGRRYMGNKRIIVDDGCTAVASTFNGTTERVRYTTIISAGGMVKWNETPAPEPVKVWSVPAAGNGSGEEQLWTRRQFVCHPYGFAFTSAAFAGQFPTDDEYATASNWNRVVSERKQIPLAFLVTNG